MGRRHIQSMAQLIRRQMSSVGKTFQCQCQPYHRLLLRRHFCPSQLSAFPKKSPFRRHSLADGTLREKILSRTKPVIGVVTGSDDCDQAEILALLGYDFIWADAEHSTNDAATFEKVILAAERRGVPTLVRIGYGYHRVIGHVQKFLGAGAQGIILPQCETADDARMIVDAVKFPPLGRRGLAGERWNAWGLGEGGGLARRVRTSNDHSVVGIIIESLRGVDALDDILSVKGIDFVFVAPTDLSSDMGLPGQIRHLDVVAIVEEVGTRVLSAGISSGTLVLTAEDYAYWRARGFQVMSAVAQNMFIDGAQGMMKGIVQYEKAEETK